MSTRDYHGNKNVSKKSPITVKQFVQVKYPANLNSVILTPRYFELKTICLGLIRSTIEVLHGSHVAWQEQ